MPQITGSRTPPEPLETIENMNNHNISFMHWRCYPTPPPIRIPSGKQLKT
ncbi:hypothetical protein ANAEL_05824 [Anaerolineales bacterium]|nr:hypothetical protein ANAEL_05824 [Anaerolineales bacterium]